MTTIGEAISRVRNTLKAVKDDAFLTDRSIYFAILKYGKTLLKREDNQNRLMKMSSLYFVSLILHITISNINLEQMDKNLYVLK